MIPFFIALAFACVAFWRVAIKLMAILALFLLVSGVVMVVQHMHHLR